MDIENIKIETERDYEKFLNFLGTLKDIKYREFNLKIVVPTTTDIIGIRSQVLRKISKVITKNSAENFLKIFEKLFSENKIEYYEEKAIYTLVLGSYKEEFEEKLKKINFYISIIDNWAICDLAPSSFKFIANNKEEFYKYLCTKINSENMWEQRFVLVMLLDFYIDNENIDKIFKICEDIKSEEYYVKMAKAWLLSMCFIKFKKETYKFLKKTNLDKWTINKTIQKIRESLRVSKEDKEKVLNFKRKD